MLVQPGKKKKKRGQCFSSATEQQKESQWYYDTQKFTTNCQLRKL